VVVEEVVVAEPVFGQPEMLMVVAEAEAEVLVHLNLPYFQLVQVTCSQ